MARGEMSQKVAIPSKTKPCQCPGADRPDPLHLVKCGVQRIPLSGELRQLRLDGLGLRSRFELPCLTPLSGWLETFAARSRASARSQAAQGLLQACPAGGHRLCAVAL